MELLLHELFDVVLHVVFYVLFPVELVVLVLLSGGNVLFPVELVEFVLLGTTTTV